MKSLALALVLAACTADTFAVPDGSVGDSGGGPDASSDGDAAACSGKGVTCTAGAQCNTFDDPKSVLDPFVNISQNGGTLTFESEQAFTCPNGLAAFVPGAPQSQQARGAIGGTAQLNVPTAVGHVRVELDMILPANPTAGATFLYVYPNTDSTHGIGLVWASGNWFVHNSVTGNDDGIDPRTGEWNHIALDVTFSANGKVELDYTDSSGTPQVESHTRSTLFGTGVVVSSVTFGAGITPLGTTTAPMTSFLDDVAFSL